MPTFTKAWKTVGPEIIKAVKKFFESSKMNRSINCTSVTLIPKNDHPATVKVYSPIACCTMLYKIISKVLVSRLQKVIALVVCEAQTGFIPGRKISDNIFLAQELVKSYTRKNVSPRCMIKIDLQKAYDSVELVYLEQVLDELGFPRKFTKWIMECVKTMNYFIMVNGDLQLPLMQLRDSSWETQSPHFSLQLPWNILVGTSML